MAQVPAASTARDTPGEWAGFRPTHPRSARTAASKLAIAGGGPPFSSTLTGMVNERGGATPLTRCRPDACLDARHAVARSSWVAAVEPPLEHLGRGRIEQRHD